MCTWGKGENWHWRTGLNNVLQTNACTRTGTAQSLAWYQSALYRKVWQKKVIHKAGLVTVLIKSEISEYWGKKKLTNEGCITELLCVFRLSFKLTLSSCNQYSVEAQRKRQLEVVSRSHSCSCPSPSALGLWILKKMFVSIWPSSITSSFMWQTKAKFHHVVLWKKNAWLWKQQIQPS